MVEAVQGICGNLCFLLNSAGCLKLLSKTNKLKLQKLDGSSQSFFFFFFGHGMWKFPGQGPNPCHRSDNAGSLTC